MRPKYMFAILGNQGIATDMPIDQKTVLELVQKKKKGTSVYTPFIQAEDASSPKDKTVTVSNEYSLSLFLHWVASIE